MRRPLVRALLLSLAVHALAVAALGAFVGIGGNGRGSPFTGDTIVATLATPRPSAPPLTAPPSAPSSIAPSAQAEAAAPLPLPLTPKSRATAFKGAKDGAVTINSVEAGHPNEPSLAARVRQFHPDAVRGALEFEVPPRGIYPQAAVEQRLQIDFVVAVVVLEDGRVEVANGTFDDPMFGPAIRAGLHGARARPAVDAAGRTVPLWGLLSFSFEFVSRHPEPK